MGAEVERRKSMAEPAKPKLLGGTAIKPPERHGWEKISYLIYDKDTGEILTRTPKSWALIFVFYVIYYTLLACFWYGMLQLFLYISLYDDKPKFQQKASIIGANPGVGMKPMQADKKLDSSMIYLVRNDNKDEHSEDGETLSNADWAFRYAKYLEKYGDTTNTTEDCSKEGKEGKKACRFNLEELGDCAKKPYGYIVEGGKNVVEPCVLLKINRIFGWEPQEYSDDDLKEAQKPNEDYPEDQMEPEVAELIKRNGKDKIYIDCQGENPFDKENLKGKMKYFPEHQGIPIHYFPYEHVENYQPRNYHNPLVAVKFRELTPGVLYHVQCKLWAKGVTHSKKERAGLVHFEIFLDDEIPE